MAIARPRSELAPDRRGGAFALSLCLLALAWPVWAQASASTPHAEAYAVAMAAWRPVHAVGALSFAFALATGWRANARGWPLAATAPAALLPPALTAVSWGGASAAQIALALSCGLAGGILGQALRSRRWLRTLAGAVAVALALAVALAALFCRGVPAPGEIGVAMVAVLFATPLMVGVVAPPAIAWQSGRLGFALRVALLAGLAWCGWRALLRLGGGDLAGLGAAAWLGVGLFGYFAWLLVFLLNGEGWGGGSRSRAAAGGERAARSGDRARSDQGGLGPGGSSGSDWSGGGGRSGGGASGSW